MSVTLFLFCGIHINYSDCGNQISTTTAIGSLLTMFVFNGARIIIAILSASNNLGLMN